MILVVGEDGNSRDFMYTVLGSVLVVVLPFEEKTTGRDSRLSCFLSFRLPCLPSAERRFSATAPVVPGIQ